MGSTVVNHEVSSAEVDDNIYHKYDINDVVGDGDRPCDACARRK